jgi:hypothetical protein
LYQAGATDSITASLSHSLPSGCSITWGGSATISNVSINGTTVTATATFNTTGTNLTITAATSCQGSPASSSSFSVFQSSINISSNNVTDGATVNVDLIITPESLKSSLTDVYFNILQSTTYYGNPDNSLSTIEQRDQDITHWKVEKALWYSNHQGINCDQSSNNCNWSSGYDISVEYWIGDEFFMFLPTNLPNLTVAAAVCLDFCGGKSWTTNFWAGDIQINTQQIDPNHWHATVDVNDFRRNVQADKQVYNLATSQFYPMILAEELHHKYQYEHPETYYPDLWDASNVMDSVHANEPYEGNTEAAAIWAARTAFNIAVAAEEGRTDNELSDPDRWCPLEADAKNEASASYIMAIECAYCEDCCPTYCP